MNQKIKTLLIVFGVIAIVIFGYYFANNLNDSSKNEQKSTGSESKKDLIKKELVDKYSALTEWEKDAQYTYQLKRVLVDSNKPILFSGYINDIIEKDGKYFIVFATDLFTKPQVIFNLECEENKVLAVAASKNENDDLLSAFGFGGYEVIAKISKVEKIKLKIGGSSNGEEVELDYSPTDTFIADGKCIDFSYTGE